jgi:hypothetical protein
VTGFFRKNLKGDRGGCRALLKPPSDTQVLTEPAVLTRARPIIAEAEPMRNLPARIRLSVI